MNYLFLLFNYKQVSILEHFHNTMNNHKILVREYLYILQLDAMIDGS